MNIKYIILLIIFSIIIIPYIFSTNLVESLSKLSWHNQQNAFPVKKSYPIIPNLLVLLNAFLVKKKYQK